MLTNKIKSLDIKVKRNISSFLIGNYKTFFKGRGLEFADFREYEIGDDTKNIDWIISSREQKTIIRRYREERELSIIFLLDLSESMSFGLKEKTKLETLEEVFLLLSYSAIKNNDKIGLILGDADKFSYFLPKKGKANLFNLVQKIDDFAKLKATFDIDRGLGYLNSLKSKNNLVFLISDKLEIDEKLLKIASIKNEVIFINVFDNFENTLYGIDGIMSFSGLSGENIMINLNDEKKKKEYLNYRIQKLDNFKKLLSRLNIKYLKLDNKSNIYKEIFLMFKR